MSKDVHKEDAFFKSAYHNSEEAPSPEVWKNIASLLDRRDAVYYRKKFITWQRVTYLLLMLCGSASMYLLCRNNDDNALTEIPAAAIIKRNIDSARRSRPSKENDTLVFPNYKNVQAGINHSIRPGNEQKNGLTEMPDRLNNQNFLNTWHPIDTNQQNKTPGLLSEEGVLQKKRKAVLPQNNNPLIIQHYQLGFQQLSASSKPLSADADFLGNRWKSFAHQPANEQITGKENSLPADATNLLSIVKNMPCRLPDSTPAATPAKTTKHKRFAANRTITPYLSADYARYNLDDEALENTSDPEEEETEIEERERHKFSFSAGALLTTRLSQKLFFKTGLVYVNIAIAIEPQTLYATANGNQSVAYKFTTSSGYAFVKPGFDINPAAGDSVNSTAAQHRLQYLTVPFLFGYELLHKNKLTITPAAGLSANLLLSTKVRTELNDRLDREVVVINGLKGLRTAYVSLVMDAQLQYKISRQVDISLMPVFKYALSPITKGNIIKTYPYSVGTGMGFTYKL